MKKTKKRKKTNLFKPQIAKAVFRKGIQKEKEIFAGIFGKSKEEKTKKKEVSAKAVLKKPETKPAPRKKAGEEKGIFAGIFGKGKEEEKAKEKEESAKAILKKPEKGKTEEEKIAFFKTKVPGFDSLVEGGIPEGSAVLVEGGPGSGKTIFCMSTAINACKQGKKVLYMSFEEPEYRLRRHMKNFGLDTRAYEKKDLLMIRRFNALDIARSVEALLSEAKKELLIEVQPVLIPKGFEPDVVLIDSLSSIGSAFSGEESRFRIYMEQLFRYLESHHMTSFLIRETSSPTHIGHMFVERGEAVSFLSDGIIAIYNVIYGTGKRGRAMEIIKMRGADIKRIIVEADIKGGKGFVVYPGRTLKGKYKLT